MGPNLTEAAIVIFLGACAVLPVPMFFAVIASILEKWQEKKK
tara:strand:- start:6517 stop:6642 length:126 start_codon:yes stop_codon:yes gene_type:complete